MQVSLRDQSFFHRLGTGYGSLQDNKQEIALTGDSKGRIVTLPVSVKGLLNWAL